MVEPECRKGVTGRKKDNLAAKMGNARHESYDG